MESLINRTGETVATRVVARFREQLDGELLTPGDREYDAARQIWNAMIDRRPALIARCTRREDVQHAVAFARDHDLLLSIRGGGHNIAGLALCDDGLAIDLSRMKTVDVNVARKTVQAQGGVTWGEFDRTTQAHGLATTGGAVSTTGIAGLTLGGGFGWLMSRYGYTIDNLLSADVALADGRLMTASEEENPDLFWALRGGGGNFGIVTSFEYRLHDVAQLLSGVIAHPLNRLPQLLAFYRDFVSSAPDELTLYAASMSLPTGDRVCALLPVWCGDLAEGERRLAPVRAFGSPLFDTVQPQPYVAVQTMLDAAVPYGRHNYWKSSFLRDVPDEAAAVLAEYAQRSTSPYSLMLLEHVHGAPTRVPRDATAFSIRDQLFHCIALASWDPGDDAAPHVGWARELWTAVQPWSAGRVYGNILGYDESSRLREAYGDNYERLARLKAVFDPSNLFRVNQNISPETAVGPQQHGSSAIGAATSNRNAGLESL
jgi:hypothetical protein